VYINKLKTLKVIRIINADGTKDSVNLQPGGRIDLAAGAKLDPAYAKEYKQYLTDTTGDLNRKANAT
jgi:hypothetical protein